MAQDTQRHYTGHPVVALLAEDSPAPGIEARFRRVAEAHWATHGDAFERAIEPLAALARERRREAEDTSIVAPR